MSIKIIIFILLLAPLFTMAQSVDTDGDGLSDEEEVNIYYTDPNSADTDLDGFNDKDELDSGFSPHRPEYRLNQLDWDKDGLNDELELRFGTDLKNSDTDGDGYDDYTEFIAGYDPLLPHPIKMAKSIRIDLARQRLYYQYNNIPAGSFLISSGTAAWPTPKGQFQVHNKIPKAWSNMAGLWMPYWMAFTSNGMYGLHELPYWPNGYREGEDHLGTPASHGCVRLGIGEAEFLYNWTEVGTPVVIN